MLESLIDGPGPIDLASGFSVYILIDAILLVSAVVMSWKITESRQKMAEQ